MKSQWVALAGASWLVLAAIGVAAQDPNRCTPPKGPAVPQASAPMSPEVLAARIDQLINEKLAASKVKPAPRTDDISFLRRVKLDVAGQSPLNSEVEALLGDDKPNKRARLVEKLLDSGLYVNHFINVWRRALLAGASNQQMPLPVKGLEDWLKERIRKNTPYDKMVSDLLTSTDAPVASMMGNRGMPRVAPPPSPLAFYQANELKPENLAASTSRLFLGVRLECAQCHNHPHASWERKQFWQFAAFFSGVQAQGQMGVREVPDRRSLKIPNTETTVQARFLDGGEPVWKPGTAARPTLVAWMTNENNRYFARAAVNRLWAQFFGIGLVEPMDDFGEDNPPSHPEVLEELARQFAVHHFDVKYVIRAITATEAYQRSSAQTDASQTDPRLFARMAIKGLSPEQLFDSLLNATYFSGDQGPTRVMGMPVDTARAMFVAKFASQDKQTEYHTSILQALSLMNGRFVDEATTFGIGRTITGTVDYYRFKDAKEAIQSLYRQTVNRLPRQQELDLLVKYVDGGGPIKKREAALGDVLWALLNSSEFMLNH